MTGKTTAGVILILAIVNLFALMWFQIIFLDDSWSILLFIIVTMAVIVFSTSGFSEGRK